MLWLTLGDIPKKPGSLKVDGKVKSSEWRKAYLCTAFYEYKKARRYMENYPASQQTRVRFCHDGDNLYCMVDFQKKKKGSTEDVVKLYISKDQDSKPQIVSVDMQKGKVTCPAGSEGIEAKPDPVGTKIEFKLPLALFGIKEPEDNKDKKEKDKSPKTCCVNLSRECGGVTTYWRGNSASVEDPVVFATFVLERK